MFQHVFAEMNSMLDDIVKHYPSAQGSRRQELLQHWSLLRRMSDGIMDEWLAFEEKMVCLRAAGFSAETDMSDTELPEKSCRLLVGGKGIIDYLCTLRRSNNLSRYYSIFRTVGRVACIWEWPIFN